MRKYITSASGESNITFSAARRHGIGLLTTVSLEAILSRNSHHTVNQESPDMSPKELMLAAINQAPIPALAVATYNFHPFNAFSQEPAYAPMLDAVAQAPNVGMLCKSGASRHSPQDELITADRQAGGDSELTITRWVTPRGELEMVHKTPQGQPGYTVEPLVKDDDDLEKFLSFLSMPCEPATIDLSGAKQFYEELGDQGLVYLSYPDPMYSVVRWFDFEDFAIRCLEQLPVILELVDREFARIRVELAAMIDQAVGYDFLFFTAGPELATPPMLSPEIFRQLVTCYQRQLVGMIKSAGHLVSIHCHGRVRAVLDQFIEMGADLLEPMEPPPQGDISLEQAREEVNGRMCLMGYIQDQDLYTAQPGEMRSKVQAIREVGAGQTGYIMTPTATPFMHPPPERFVRNYVEFVQAAAEQLP